MSWDSPWHLAATMGGDEAPPLVDAGSWASVTWIGAKGHLAAVERAAAASRTTGHRSSGFGVEAPLLPGLLDVLAQVPRRTVVDVTHGPATLSHAAHHAASILRLPCRLGEDGDRITFPVDPGRRPPGRWAAILGAVAALERPARPGEISRLTGMSESTVRYHVFGRGCYLGLVDCGALDFPDGRIAITALGRVYLERGLITQPSPRAPAPIRQPLVSIRPD